MSYERMLAGVIKRPIETILQRFDKAIVHRPGADGGRQYLLRAQTPAAQ